MEKLKLTDGYTLLEMMLVLMIISCCSLFMIKKINLSDESEVMIAEYGYQQFRAMHDLDDSEFVYQNMMSYKPITFNKKGNVNISQTVTLNIAGKERSFTIFLGGGRIEAKE